MAQTTGRFQDALTNLPPRTRARAIKISHALQEYMDEESAMEIGVFKASRDEAKSERVRR